jgi:hypothetical protein
MRRMSERNAYKRNRYGGEGRLQELWRGSLEHESRRSERVNMHTLRGGAILRQSRREKVRKLPSV